MRKRKSQGEHEEEEGRAQSDDGDTGCVEEEEREEKREEEEEGLLTLRLCTDLAYTLRSHTHTVDINNHLLIFICSGEMWGQSNPVRNCLSTCLSLCVVPYIKCSWSLNESFCGHFHPVCRHWNNMSSFSFCITRDTLSHGDCGIGRSKAIYNTYFYRTGWEMQGLILFSFCHIPSLPLLHTSHSFSFTVLTAVDRHICPLHH